MEKYLNFEVKDVKILNMEDSSEFLNASIDAFSTGVSRNDTICNFSSLKSSAPTIYEKPVLFTIDPMHNDFYTHVDPEKSLIAGFVIPNSANYKEDEDGRIILNVKAKIWSRYATKFVDIFKKDGNKKKVSVEVMLVDAEKEEDSGLLRMNDWIFSGICVLSDLITEAIPGANIVLNFAEENQKYKEALAMSMDNKEDRISGNIQEENKMKDKIKEQEKENLEDIAFEEPVDEVVTEEVVDEPVSEVVDEQVIEEDFSEEEDEVDVEEPEEVEDQENVDEEEMSDDIEFSLNSAQITEILRKKLSEYSYEDEYGKWARYWVRAYDEKFVYIYDFEEDETYRAPYKIEGGEVSISLEEKEEVISGGYKTVAEYEQSFSISKEMTEAILTIFKDYDKYAVIEEELSKEEKNYESIFAIFNERIVKMSEDRNMYLSKNEELQKFKDEIEEKDFSNDVKVFLKDIEERVVISEEQLEDMKKKSFDFKENIDEWKTACKAEVFELPKRDVEGQQKIFAIPWDIKPKNEKKPLWKKK